jgi:hypothetical protein
MSVIALKCPPKIKVTVVDLNESRIAGWNDENLDNFTGLRTKISRSSWRSSRYASFFFFSY